MFENQDILRHVASRIDELLVRPFWNVSGVGTGMSTTIPGYIIDTTGDGDGGDDDALLFRSDNICCNLEVIMHSVLCGAGCFWRSREHDSPKPSTLNPKPGGPENMTALAAHA